MARNYNKGYDAYQEGVSKNENPYDENTYRFDDWNDGWDKAASEGDCQHLESANELMFVD